MLCQERCCGVEYCEVWKGMESYSYLQGPVGSGGVGSSPVLYGKARNHQS